MKHAIFALSVLALVACSKKDDKKDVKASSLNQTPTCRAGISTDHNDAGCKITLVSPVNCATIDVSNGKQAVFTFTAEGPDCRAPFLGYMGGNPITQIDENNFTNIDKHNIGPHESVKNQGGEFVVDARIFQGLESSDGTYEWLIENNGGMGTRGGSGSGPASVVIRVTK